MAGRPNEQIEHAWIVKNGNNASFHRRFGIIQPHSTSWRTSFNRIQGYPQRIEMKKKTAEIKEGNVTMIRDNLRLTRSAYNRPNSKHVVVFARTWAQWQTCHAKQRKRSDQNKRPSTNKKQPKEAAVGVRRVRKIMCQRNNQKTHIRPSAQSHICIMYKPIYIINNKLQSASLCLCKHQASPLPAAFPSFASSFVFLSYLYIPYYSQQTYSLISLKIWSGTSIFGRMKERG